MKASLSAKTLVSGPISVTKCTRGSSMKTSKLLLGIPALICAMLFVSTAFADGITVVNPSFETLPAGGLPVGGCGTGCLYSEDVAAPGWTGSGSGLYGQFQPGTQDSNFAYFNSLPDGITVAYSNGSTLSQTVGVTVLAGVTYTLQVDIGARNDTSANGFDGTADLMLGTTLCAATGTQPSPGSWSTYTATCLGTSGDAGDPITIQLNSSGGQGDFDDVVLADNSTATPEPGTLMLFGSGLLGLPYLLRRKRSARS
jgi:hypothetical protein